jgi:hypothetical protein
MVGMNLTRAREARDEALAGRLTDHRTTWLANVCRQRAERLGAAGVPGHAISIESRRWPGLPDGVSGTSITRGDVFGLSDAAGLDLFTASYVFGVGRRGYGRTRYERILAGSDDLGAVLDVVRDIGRCQGPYAVYLHWMRQAAADVSRAADQAISPELVELTLFDLALSGLPVPAGSTVAADDSDEGDAAD